VRSYRDGPSAIPAFLEDFAYLVEALITLYQSTSNLEYLDSAEELMEEALETFWDASSGMFFDARAAGELIVRPRSIFDNPVPSGTSSAAFALLRLWALTGNERYLEIAARPLRVDPDLLRRAAPSLAYLLSALDIWQTGAIQVAIVPGEAGGAEILVRQARGRFLPNLVLAVGRGDRPALLEGRTAIDGRATAYVCRRFVCDLPVTDVAALAQQLETATSSPESSAS
jgi:uncharacterized protein YyaL (SSP411 family)